MQLILQQMVEKLKEIIEESSEILLEGGISKLNLELRSITDEIMSDLVGEILTELDEELRTNKERKRDYEVVDKHEKNIETIFGTVNYERTYYKNKNVAGYKYLLDELINVKPHMNKTLNIEARLINEASDLSYRKSGSKILENTEFSDTSTMNSIRNIDPIPNNAVEIKIKNKKKKILYIEADEDHVGNQHGTTLEPKLIYVHEGYVKESEKSKRNKLLNPRYFGGIYSKSDDLWLEVLNYIYEAYDYEYIEKIYLSGDAALWIRNGLKWINKSVYVLDRFHLMKYVKKMTAHLDNSYEKEFWKLLKKGKKKELEVLYKVIKSETKIESKLESVRESIRYIKKYYIPARRYYNADYTGCSAEGHISHIYSSRLSSRPLGWSKVGADAMARIRVFMVNGGNIFKYVQEKFKAEKKEEKQIKMIKRISKKIKKKIKNINIEIPVVRRGIKNGLYCAVNNLR
jgi:hypothetical protein